MRLIDLIGQRFGRLVVVSLGERPTGVAWNCLCDCGQTAVVTTRSLRNAHARSCGCLQREVRGAANRSHGNTAGGKLTPEFSSWLSARRRCHDPNFKTYAKYGARGITMCPQWREDFSVFLAEMGQRPPGHTLDRINNAGNYEPGNCRWSDKLAQANNMTSNLVITVHGEQMTAAQAARKYRINYGTFIARMGRYGMPPEAAIAAGQRTIPSP